MKALPILTIGSLALGAVAWILLSERRVDVGVQRPTLAKKDYGPEAPRLDREVLAPRYVTDWSDERANGPRLQNQLALHASTRPNPPVADGDQAPHSRSACWEKAYQDATLGEVIDAKRALVFALADATRDYYDTEFRAGRYEVSHPMPDEQGRLPVPTTPDELSETRVAPSGEMRTVRLPKEGFEDAYAMQEEIVWLAGRQEDLRKSRP